MVVYWSCAQGKLFCTAVNKFGIWSHSKAFPCFVKPGLERDHFLEPPTTQDQSVKQFLRITIRSIPAPFSFLDLPDTEVNELGARGIGEIGLAGAAAATAAAIHRATGVRVRELPVHLENLLGVTGEPAASLSLRPKIRTGRIRFGFSLPKSCWSSGLGLPGRGIRRGCHSLRYDVVLVGE
jgi:hypothetical protein